MPRDLVGVSRKRQQADGINGSAYSPKRLQSISGAESRSSIDSLSNLTIPAERLSDSANGSSWNLTSAAVTSDCSTSIMCTGNRTISVNVLSSGPPSSVFEHSQSPSDGSNDRMKALQITDGCATVESSRKDIWMYRSPASRCAESSSQSDYSEITNARSSASLTGASSSGKVTHIISRREKSSLNSRWGMHEEWVNEASESDAMLREKWWERNRSLLNTDERNRITLPLTTCESGRPCTTRDSSAKDIRSAQRISHIDVSDCKDSFTVSSHIHTRKEGFLAPRVQAERGSFYSRSHVSTETDSLSSSLTKGKAEDLSPSFILSSGRLSLEEEARLGRRARTIDDDFEEYFSSLILK